MKRASIIVIVSLAAAATARADKEHQGAEIVRTRCGNCHVVGQGKREDKAPHGMVDLTMAVKSHKDEWLRAWLRDPHQLKRDTPCYPFGLDARQIDVLIAFLHGRAEVKQAHAIAPARSRPPAPPEPPPPPPGLTRGR